MAAMIITEFMIEDCHKVKNMSTARRITVTYTDTTVRYALERV